jgi:hypothetical protein
MNVTNFKKLKDFLIGLESRRFNFTKVVSMMDSKKECGTVCCAVGWFPDIFDNCKWVRQITDEDICSIIVDNKQEMYHVAASKVLEIPTEHAKVLFTPFDDDAESIWDGWIYKDKEFEDLDGVIQHICDNAKMKIMPLCGSDASPEDLVDLIDSYMDEYYENIPSF